tara:strand:- start:939 stop:1349 length:411 start_codon:yes stop_codon:yes gene_type:complete
MTSYRTPEKSTKNGTCPGAPKQKYRKISEDLILDEERHKIEKEFGKTNFEICIPSSELDEVLTHEKDVIISHSFGCYCWNNFRKTEYYHMRSNVPITKRDVIKKLIELDFNTFCNHSFLEDIFMKTPCQIGLYFGS